MTSPSGYRSEAVRLLRDHSVSIVYGNFADCISMDDCQAVKRLWAAKKDAGTIGEARKIANQITKIEMRKKRTWSHK